MCVPESSVKISVLRKIDHKWQFVGWKAVEQFRENGGLAAYHNRLFRTLG